MENEYISKKEFEDKIAEMQKKIDVADVQASIALSMSIFAFSNLPDPKNLISKLEENFSKNDNVYHYSLCSGYHNEIYREHSENLVKGLRSIFQ